MRFRRFAGFALRVTVVAVLLGAIWYWRGGMGDVTKALAATGWGALAAICAWHLLSLGLCALAQRGLNGSGKIAPFLLGRWVHEAVGELAGFLPMSGEVAAARTLARRGFAVTRAAALTIVDLTCEGLAQLAFTALGVILWFARHPAGEVGRWALIGLAVGLPGIVGFLLVQRSPLVRLIETLPHRMMPRHFQAPDEEKGTLAEIESIYADRLRVAGAASIHLVAWLIGTGEAGLALVLLGHRLPVLDVVALEAFITALRGAAFFVPAALGVQEGAYIVIGAALGLPPEIALAVSLLKRGREIAFGVPGFIAWQAIETRQSRAG
jgi:putative membrane protein